MMKKISWVIVVIMVAALFIGCAKDKDEEATGNNRNTEKVYALKASSGDNEDYPSVLGIQKFADLVEEKSDGRITIDVYAGGALYGDQKEEAVAVANGTIAFSVPQVSALSTWEPSLDFFSMLYLFDNEDHAQRVLDSDIATELFAPLEDDGIVVLAPFTGGGMRSFYNSIHPIKVPADIAGMKLRTNNSTLMNDAFSEMKIIPTPISWGELYTSLMQKSIDGAEHAPTDVLSSNFWEACKYYSLDEHSYELIPLIASKKALDELPDDLRQIVYGCAEEALQYNREVADEQSSTAISDLKAKGMEINDDIDKAAFVEAVKETNEKFANEYGKDIYDKIKAMK